MTLIQSIIKYIATLGPMGFMPVAPGTFGTLVSVILLWVLSPSPPVHIAIFLVALAGGTFVSHEAEKLFGRKDASPIVIDEFAGYLVSTAFLPQSRGYLIAAFILFRLFDILKPPPIMEVQRLPGGVGIMADDLIAGIYTNLILQVWRIFLQR